MSIGLILKMTSMDGFYYCISYITNIFTVVALINWKWQDILSEVIRRRSFTALIKYIRPQRRYVYFLLDESLLCRWPIIHNYVDTFAYHCAAEALMETTGFKFQYDFSSDSERASYEEKYNELYSQCMAELYSSVYMDGLRRDCLHQRARH